MSAKKSSIASFGGELHLFAVENGKFEETTYYSSGYKKARPSRGRIISWAKDGQWLVGPAEDSGLVPVFKYVNNQLNRMRHIKEEVSAAGFFNTTNRHVAFGTKTGAVRVWNVKDKKSDKTLCEIGVKPVTFIDVNKDDCYVAAAGPYDLKPTIQLYGLTSNKLINTLELDGPSEISDLKFSPGRKNYLGCSTLEGALTVWDVYKAIPVFNHREAHISSCTGIAMSPINYDVVASVAMSENDSLALHDIRLKKTVSRISIGAVLTCVDLLSPEPIVVLGSQDGRILLFDLRSMKVMHDIQAHKGAVECVRVTLDRQTIHKFEDGNVNTPETPESGFVAPLEMSVADLFTPPPFTHLQRSGVGKSVGISPIHPSPHFHSTPNPTNIPDSFLELLGDSPFPAPHSPLERKGVTLNGIIEEEDPNNIQDESRVDFQEIDAIKREEPTPPNLEGNKDGSLREVIKRMIQEELSGMKVTEVVREVVKDEMNSLTGAFRQALREELKDATQELAAQTDRNGYLMCAIRRDISALSFLIKLDNCQIRISESETEE